MSNWDQTHDNSEGRDHAVTRAGGHGANESTANLRDLERIDRQVNRFAAEMKGDKDVQQTLRGLSAELSSAQQLEIASRGQRDSVMRVLELVPAAERGEKGNTALSLIREQSQALQAINSNLQLRGLEARLRVEEHNPQASPAAQLRALVTPVADTAGRAATEAVHRVNEAMRTFVSECQTGANRPEHARVTSSNTEFSVSPEGKITMYARPGDRGDLNVNLPGGQSIAISFTSTERGQVHWNWQSHGNDADKVQALEGTHEPQLLLNLERSGPERSSVTHESDKAESKSGWNAEGRAEVPVSKLDVGINGAYERSNEKSRGLERIDTVKTPPPIDRAGLSFEVHFNPPVPPPVQILRGPSQRER